MEITKDIKETYAQLLCTITQAMTWAQKGNVPETEIAVENIRARKVALKARFHAIGHEGDLASILAQASEDEIHQSLALHAASYADAPDMFLAEAYLVSAENAMKEDRQADALKDYAHIKPGEQLRKYLDAQVNPLHNLKGRAAKLDKFVA